MACVRSHVLSWMCRSLMPWCGTHDFTTTWAQLQDGDSVRIATDADLREAITYATEGASHTLRLDVASLP